MIVVVLCSIIIIYSGYLVIELRSYLLAHALIIDLEREKKNQYILHGALYYGAMLYKQYKATWQLPYKFTYTSINGENITLEFATKIIQAQNKQVMLKATVEGHAHITAQCILKELQKLDDKYAEPSELELELELITK